MLITIAGIGVLLRSVRKRAIFLLYELNSLLRTILYAGKTELAVTGRLHSSRRQLIVAARTNVGTNATVNTNIGQVAAISAGNNKEIGELIAEAMEKVGHDGVITVEESKSFGTNLKVVEGMQFDKGYISPYFVTDPERIEAYSRQ